jgi:hypothetical protein
MACLSFSSPASDTGLRALEQSRLLLTLAPWPGVERDEAA